MIFMNKYLVSIIDNIQVEIKNKLKVYYVAQSFEEFYLLKFTYSQIYSVGIR